MGGCEDRVGGCEDRVGGCVDRVGVLNVKKSAQSIDSLSWRFSSVISVCVSLLSFSLPFAVTPDSGFRSGGVESNIGLVNILSSITESSSGVSNPLKGWSER